MQNKPQYIVIHHSASSRDYTSIKQINDWHEARYKVLGFPKSELGFYIGYHRVITGDGAIAKTRNDREEGAHALTDDYMNLKSIGICLTGNFEQEEPSKAQLRSLASEIKRYVAQYNIPSENIAPHSSYVDTLCCGSNLSKWLAGLLLDKPAANKVKAKIKNDNAFSCLFIVDDELSISEVKSEIRNAQIRISDDSNNKLALVPTVSFQGLPVWDNTKVKQIAESGFDMRYFQSVVAIYKKGKFRKALGEMNPNDEEFGVLINISFEAPEGRSVEVVIVHELMHQFFYQVGMEYTKNVHDTPNRFDDDFEKLEKVVDKLYFNSPEAEPIEDSVNDGNVEGSNNMSENNETRASVAGVKTSEFWLTLLQSVSGLFLAFGFFTPEQANVFVQASMAIVGAVIALVPLLAYTASRVKVKLGK